jgi:hypothetical protein
MDPVANAARLFAFTYYLNHSNASPGSPKEAGQYARGNWKQFLPCVTDARFLTTPSRFDKRQKI